MLLIIIFGGSFSVNVNILNCVEFSIDKSDSLLHNLAHHRIRGIIIMENLLNIKYTQFLDTN